jgi:hypothetical protein
MGEGDKSLVGQLCQAQNCPNQRLCVAFSWNKEDAWALYVRVPDGMPSDKSPSRHASYRWLGEPDEEVRRILDEQLKADPNWYRGLQEWPGSGPVDQGAGLFRVFRSGMAQG